MDPLLSAIQGALWSTHLSRWTPIMLFLIPCCHAISFHAMWHVLTVILLWWCIALLVHRTLPQLFHRLPHQPISLLTMCLRFHLHGFIVFFSLFLFLFITACQRSTISTLAPLCSLHILLARSSLHSKSVEYLSLDLIRHKSLFFLYVFLVQIISPHTQGTKENDLCANRGDIYPPKRT